MRWVWLGDAALFAAPVLLLGIFSFALMANTPNPPTGLIAGAALAFLGLSILVSWAFVSLAYRRLRLLVEADQIVLVKGLWWPRVTQMPRASLQVAFVTRPMERWFGLTTAIIGFPQGWAIRFPGVKDQKAFVAQVSGRLQ